MSGRNTAGHIFKTFSVAEESWFERTEDGCIARALGLLQVHRNYIAIIIDRNYH
jgi:hypothetical protein